MQVKSFFYYTERRSIKIYQVKNNKPIYLFSINYVEGTSKGQSSDVLTALQFRKLAQKLRCSSNADTYKKHMIESFNSGYYNTIATKKIKIWSV